jgi:hypothetical protein
VICHFFFDCPGTLALVGWKALHREGRCEVNGPDDFHGSGVAAKAVCSTGSALDKAAQRRMIAYLCMHVATDVLKKIRFLCVRGLTCKEIPNI